MQATVAFVIIIIFVFVSKTIRVLNVLDTIVGLIYVQCVYRMVVVYKVNLMINEIFFVFVRNVIMDKCVNIQMNSWVLL